MKDKETRINVGDVKLADGIFNNPSILTRLSNVSDIFKSDGFKLFFPNNNVVVVEEKLIEMGFYKCDYLTVLSNANEKAVLVYTYKLTGYDLFITVDNGKLSFFSYRIGDENMELFAVTISTIMGNIVISKKISLICEGEKGIETYQYEIAPLEIDFDLMYNDDFASVSTNAVKSLNDNDNGLYLFYGDAGSGKTNFIKWLITQVEREFIYAPSNLINSLSTPAFTKFLIKNPNSVLILEDCDEYVKERNIATKDSVSTILNISDGILSDVLKMNIICTFNSKIKNIDKALLRKGRLIAKYEFGELNDEKAKQLADKLGIEVPKNKTLCNFFNTEENDFTKQESKKSIGLIA